MSSPSIVPTRVDSRLSAANPNSDYSQYRRQNHPQPHQTQEEHLKDKEDEEELKDEDNNEINDSDDHGGDDGHDDDDDDDDDDEILKYHSNPKAVTTKAAFRPRSLVPTPLQRRSTSDTSSSVSSSSSSSSSSSNGGTAAGLSTTEGPTRSQGGLVVPDKSLLRSQLSTRAPAHRSKLSMQYTPSDTEEDLQEQDSDDEPLGLKSSAHSRPTMSTSSSSSSSFAAERLRAISTRADRRSMPAPLITLEPSTISTNAPERAPSVKSTKKMSLTKRLSKLFSSSSKNTDPVADAAPATSTSSKSTSDPVSGPNSPDRPQSSHQVSSSGSSGSSGNSGHSAISNPSHGRRKSERSGSFSNGRIYSTPTHSTETIPEEAEGMVEPTFLQHQRSYSMPVGSSDSISPSMGPVSTVNKANHRNSMLVTSSTGMNQRVATPTHPRRLPTTTPRPASYHQGFGSSTNRIGDSHHNINHRTSVAVPDHLYIDHSGLGRPPSRGGAHHHAEEHPRPRRTTTGDLPQHHPQSHLQSSMVDGMHNLSFGDLAGGSGSGPGMAPTHSRRSSTPVIHTNKFAHGEKLIQRLDREKSTVCFQTPNKKETLIARDTKIDPAFSHLAQHHRNEFRTNQRLSVVGGAALQQQLMQQQQMEQQQQQQQQMMHTAEPGTLLQQIQQAQQMQQMQQIQQMQQRQQRFQRPRRSSEDSQRQHSPQYHPVNTSSTGVTMMPTPPGSTPVTPTATNAGEGHGRKQSGNIPSSFMQSSGNMSAANSAPGARPRVSSSKRNSSGSGSYFHLPTTTATATTSTGNLSPHASPTLGATGTMGSSGGELSVAMQHQQYQHHQVQLQIQQHQLAQLQQHQQLVESSAAMAAQFQTAASPLALMMPQSQLPPLPPMMPGAQASSVTAEAALAQQQHVQQLEQLQQFRISQQQVLLKQQEQLEQSRAAVAYATTGAGAGAVSLASQQANYTYLGLGTVPVHYGAPAAPVLTTAMGMGVGIPMAGSATLNTTPPLGPQLMTLSNTTPPLGPQLLTLNHTTPPLGPQLMAAAAATPFYGYHQAAHPGVTLGGHHVVVGAPIVGYQC